MFFEPLRTETPNKSWRAVFGSGMSDNVVLQSYPTNNCQFASIGNGYEIINISRTNKDKAIQILKECRKLSGQPMLLFDLYHTMSADFEKLLPKHLYRLEHPYISTNESRMILYLVDIRNL